MIKSYIVKKKRKLEDFLRENNSYMMPIILIVGFIGDTLTLNQVDQVFDNLVLVVHLLIVGTMILLLASRDTFFGRRFKVSERQSTITGIMLFSFGGLFSGFTIFYAKSGSLIASWPFILAFILLMIGTEVRRQYYQKIILQITLFYIAIFSYLIFSVPVVIKKMGPGIYFISGAISLLVFFAYLSVVYKFAKQKIKNIRIKIVVRVISTFLIFNFLYFANIIPPIPLSLKFRAVYHDFSKIQAVEYRGFYEPTSKFVFWKKRSNVFHRREGEAVFVYSQIYAPVNLNTDIYHKWEYFDKEKTRWVETDQVRIPITGGRKDGYRGYSKKTNVFPGSWRVRITTERNQLIGQYRFVIKNAEEDIILKEEVFR